jgi:hypothetical protein
MGFTPALPFISDRAVAFQPGHARSGLVADDLVTEMADFQVGYKHGG